MRLATTEEYKSYWQTARVWCIATYQKEYYHSIGAIAEYNANKHGVSLYNQSLPVPIPEPEFRKMSESEYDWIRELKFYRCNTCLDDARLRWFDRLYGDVICSTCGKSAAHIPYKEYLERDDL